MTYQPPTYDLTDTDKWMTHLANEGYAVIQNILSDDDVKTNLEQFKKDWTHVSPKFDFRDKATWGIEHAPMMYGKGMAVFNGFGNSDFMWNLRLNPNILKIFQTIHSTDELAVSMDGFSVFLSKKQKSKPWLHIDQNPCNPIYSIQGAYNFFKVDEEDAGFMVVPKSHLTFRPAVSHKKDWIMVAEEGIVRGAVKLKIPENCFTLWNSKVIHSNVGMSKSKKNIELNRLTAYITYLPKYLQSKKIVEERRKAYMDGETTSHWANKCSIKKYPYGFGKRYKERGYRQITPKLINDGIPEERLRYI